MSEKIAMSSEWRPEERLLLIGDMASVGMAEPDPWKSKALHNLIWSAVVGTAKFLELNRVNYKQFVTDAAPAELSVEPDPLRRPALMPDEEKPQKLWGIPVHINPEMKTGTAVLGRFDEIAEGLEVHAIVAVADTHAGGKIVFTEDALRKMAEENPGRAVEQLDTSSLPVYVFENVDLSRFEAKYEEMFHGVADELLTLLCRNAEEIYYQGLKDARRPGLYPYGVDDNPAWGDMR